MASIADAFGSAPPALITRTRASSAAFATGAGMTSGEWLTLTPTACGPIAAASGRRTGASVTRPVAVAGAVADDGDDGAAPLHPASPATHTHAHTFATRRP